MLRWKRLNLSLKVKNDVCETKQVSLRISQAYLEPSQISWKSWKVSQAAYLFHHDARVVFQRDDIFHIASHILEQLIKNDGEMNPRHRRQA